MKPSVSFFCPAYYDEANLPRLIPEVVKLLEEVAEKYEIVIIEDGSPDRTGEVAEGLCLAHPNIRVIHHQTNQGYGATIAEGLREANKYQWCLTTDGDCQYNIEEFKNFVPYLDQYDAVIGYRKNRAMSWYRQFQSTTYNFLIRILFGLAVKDVNCSFKIVKRDFLNQFFLLSKSAFIDAELLLQLKKHQAKILELPVTHFPRLHGRASGASFKVVALTLRETIFFWLLNTGF